MNSCHVLLPIIAAALLPCGCSTTSHRNTATVAARHGANPSVVDALGRGRPLTIPQLEELGRRGVPDQTIIDYLRTRDDVYRLTTSQVLRLREGGLSDGVIDYLLASPYQLAWRAPRSYPIRSSGYRNNFGRRSGAFVRGSGHRGGGRHR